MLETLKTSKKKKIKNRCQKVMKFKLNTFFLKEKGKFPK